MDFFEKAHVARNRDDKHSKGEQTMKKQLKLMLQGYKTSNTEIIKEAENVKIDLDDSTSVSGFSDLNLTGSTHEDDTNIREPIEILSENSVINGKNYNLRKNSSELDSQSKNYIERSVSPNDTIHDLSSDSSVEEKDYLSDTCDSPLGSNSTISSNSYNENVQSLTDLKTTLHDLESLSSNSSSTNSSQSKFDPDGKLALQILDKLQAKESTRKEKRKLPIILNEPDSKSPSKEKKKRRKDTGDKVWEKSKNNMQVCSSPPYVSITATDVKPQRFDEILGDYKHSTVRILPSVHDTSSLSPDCSGFFTEICESANITMEKDCSTITEDNNSFNNDITDTNIEKRTGPSNNKSLYERDISPSRDVDEYEELASESDEPSSFAIYIVKNNCIIVLKHPSELYFHGKLLAQALNGHIEVGGYTLKDEECPIIAPVYSYAQCFKTVENNNDYSNLFNKLKTVGLSLAEAREVTANIGEYGGVLLLKPFECPRIEFVANNFTNVHLFKYSNKDISLEQASNVLRCSLYSKKPPKCLEENPAWKSVMEIVPRVPFKGLACGGKGSGKSTFLRYYVNTLLHKSSVLVIDLDPGQSEFTVAGHVSATVVDSPIFGPSFTHLRTPQRALNIGIISTMDNVSRYINAVKSIIVFSAEHFSHLPWIINTMGMTNALGLEIITLIIMITEPDLVLQYDSNNAKKNFASHLSPHNVLDLYKKFRYNKLFRGMLCPNLEYSFILAPDAEAITKSRSLAPRDERYLSFLAYFGQLASNIKPNGWLLDIVPYEVCLKDLYVAVNIPFKDCVTKVINGKVVGLCQHNPRTQCKERVFTLSDQPLLCHGHGLIRGIDWEKEVLYVITPLPASKLCEINTILYADWIPDLKGQEAHLPEGTKVPYRMTAQQQQMEFMTPPRRRFNPLQLLKMTRNS
ncbi:polynucleotide 5'-hydroxyl-kinase NOL9 [Zerene cesonia]|uniref:polynucleotide 5'-hydroxyl-kinase NOL9 n=1 Tax=Zerene cesonia TaxID=33412 RepID=UPI0018E51B29|nr:polynucleotide 5'-hydroxyl-kinase NOL9 [Zerene cesonia]